MKKDITRAIIDATVERSLREIDEDPRRSIRKLADMSRYYSKGRFIQSIYQTMQDLLRNEESPYYSAIDHLFHHTSRKALKSFGINIGYSSMTKGGKQLRANEQKYGHPIPWLVMMEFGDSPHRGLSLNDIEGVISEGTSLGIYTYFVSVSECSSVIGKLCEIFRKYDDCAFLLKLPDDELSPEQISVLSETLNTIVLLLSDGDCTSTNLMYLRRAKVWVAAYDYYGSGNISSAADDSKLREFVAQETSFAFLIAKEGTPSSDMEEIALRIKEKRIQPNFPVFVFDLFGDAKKIDGIVSDDRPCWFKICADGSVHTDSGVFFKDEDCTKRSLRSLFEECLK